MNCSHCDGMLLVDSFDPNTRTCSCCGRNNFRPPPEVLADVGQGKPSCSEARIHGRGTTVAGRGHEPSILIGHLNLGRRRFL